MIPIICIVGTSNVGKTTFIEKLLPELTRRGYKVGTVKHDVHGFEMDREGKDTWRHRQAGAQTIAISSPVQMALIRRTSDEMPLEELVSRLFWAEDLVLAEGFKRLHFPKIEVFRSEKSEEPLCGPGDNLMALVSDDTIIAPGGAPRFGADDAVLVADLIEDRFLRERKRPKIAIHLDGHKLPLNDFVADFVRGGICGMLSSLRGWSPPRQLDIHIRLEEDA